MSSCIGIQAETASIGWWRQISVRQIYARVERGADWSTVDPSVVTAPIRTSSPLPTVNSQPDPSGINLDISPYRQSLNDTDSPLVSGLFILRSCFKVIH